jgi:hypothetical protein
MTRCVAVVSVLLALGLPAATTGAPVEVGFDGGFSFVQVSGGDSEIVFGVPASVIGFGVPQLRATVYPSPRVGAELTAGIRFAEDSVDAQLGGSLLLFTAEDPGSASPYVRGGIHFTDPGAGPRLGLGLRVPVQDRLSIRTEAGFLWSIRSGSDIYAWNATVGASVLFP